MCLLRINWISFKQIKNYIGSRIVKFLSYFKAYIEVRTNQMYKSENRLLDSCCGRTEDAFSLSDSYVDIIG